MDWLALNQSRIQMDTNVEGGGRRLLGRPPWSGVRFTSVFWASRASGAAGGSDSSCCSRISSVREPALVWP